MVAQDETCVVCNDVSSQEALNESEVDADKPTLPTQDKDSGVQFDKTDTGEEQSRGYAVSETISVTSSMEDEAEASRRKRSKGFSPAPNLLGHTTVEFWPARLELRCCEECGHCAAYCSSQKGLNWLEGSDWYCQWHWSGTDEESTASCRANSAELDWDEVEEVADEWDGRILGPKRLRRAKGSGKTPRAPSLTKECRSAQTDQAGRHDVTSRGQAKLGRLAEAIAAKKANIEAKLQRANLSRRGPPTISERPSPQQSPSKRPVAAKTKRVKFELKEEDAAHFAASDEEAQLLKILALLQHRDLLPEDYDLLLRLDEKISKKTVGSKQLKTLRSRCLSDGDVGVDSDFVSGRCAVCMDGYCAGQVVKWLPCQHVFHSNCIDTWLSDSSSVCPLDGMEV